MANPVVTATVREVGLVHDEEAVSERLACVQPKLDGGESPGNVHRLAVGTEVMSCALQNRGLDICSESTFSEQHSQTPYFAFVQS